MKCLMLRIVVVTVSVAFGCVACSNSPHSEPEAPAPGPVPAAAARVATNVVSRDPATVRNSLAFIYSTQVNAAALAPTGTQMRVQPGTWQQNGDEARLRAVVTVPHRKPVTEVIYLVREEGQWRVLFIDAP